MTRILVVEDNKLNMEMLTRRLEKLDFEIIKAVDGQEALNAARDDSPHIILMDINLPGIDGWEATKILKSDDDTSSIPIIALTAHAMDEHRTKADAVGFDGYATKPIDFKELVETILSLTAEDNTNDQ